MKNLIVIIFILNTLQSQACTCEPLYMTEKYQNSDFTASAKILKVEPNPTDKNTHLIEIEILNLFKGSYVTKLLLDSRLNSSCAFMIPVNSIWLLFAKKDSQGLLRFGYCSNCEQIDKHTNQTAIQERHIKQVNQKLEFLNFIKKNQVIIENKYNLTLLHTNHNTDSLRGFDEKEKFAVFEVVVSPNLSIKSVTALKPFINNNLYEKIEKYLSNNVVKSGNKEGSIPEETKIVLAYFYYASDGKYPSFITQFDL